jgi:hypothetical protein
MISRTICAFEINQSKRLNDFNFTYGTVRAFELKSQRHALRDPERDKNCNMFI